MRSEGINNKEIGDKKIQEVAKRKDVIGRLLTKEELNYMRKLLGKYIPDENMGDVVCNPYNDLWDGHTIRFYFGIFMTRKYFKYVGKELPERYKQVQKELNDEKTWRPKSR